MNVTYGLMQLTLRSNGLMQLMQRSNFTEFICKRERPRAAVVHLNFRAESTFPVPVCNESPGHWVNKADTH